MSLKNYLRSLKFSYTTYNFFHRQQLQHNKQAYLLYGFKQSLHSSISSEKFKDLPADLDLPWLDVGFEQGQLEKKLSANDFSEDAKNCIREWPVKGYAILNRFFTEAECDAINHEIEDLLQTGKAEMGYGKKIMFANRKSGLIKSVTRREDLTSILSFILGKKVTPFQTINFLVGSEQKAHSDSIHMTTYPLGYLIAVWIALEDIDENCGPLHYYPGSHKLAYVLNKDYERGGSQLTVGAENNYLKYEEKIEEIISESKIPKKQFLAKKGDILIWHANLVHGGDPILREGSTRKSMVIHYFAEDVIKYHEITERPALLQG
jgi:ectoine hydroxylase